MNVYYRFMRIKDSNKKEAIYRATITLLNKIGFSDISMSKIAEEAEVSPSTIYVYFENKDDMMVKVYKNAKEKLSNKMFAGYGNDLPIRSSFELITRNYIRFVLENKEEFLFMEQFNNSPYVNFLDKSDIELLFQPLHDLMANGKKQRVVKNVEDSLLFAHIETPIFELAKRSFRGQFTFTEENIESLVNMSWDAIKG